MRLLEQHTTPDGLLRFKVVVDDGGDVSLGFDGYGWHTHGDILAGQLRLPMAEAVRKYVDDLVGGRAVIGVASVGGVTRDVWVDDAPAISPYTPLEESIVFRTWDGRVVPVGEPDAAGCDVDDCGEFDRRRRRR